MNVQTFRPAAPFGDSETGGMVTRAPRYPAQLARLAATKDGAAICLRPIRRDDARRLIDFHQHLSPRSVDRDLFFAHPTLSAVEVRRFTCVDYVDRMAFVAEEKDRLIAVGRYDRIPGTAEAEIAFVVADRSQDRGIATLLLDALADAAWRTGITTLVASVPAGNGGLLGAFIDSGFPVSENLEDDTVTVRLLIEPSDTRRSGSSSSDNQESSSPGGGT